MPYNGLGVYNLPTPEYPAVPGTVITAEDRNTIDNDIRGALSIALPRDGQAPLTGNLDFGNFGGLRLGSMAAAVAGAFYTGNHNFPTQPPGTNNTLVATTAFVIQQAFLAALPAQGGNAGKFLTTDGTNASWQYNEASMVTVSRSSNTILAEANRANVISYTAGGFTQTFPSVASLRTGWFVTLDASALATSAEGIELEAPATISTTSTTSLNITAASVLTVATGLAIATGDLAIVRRTSAPFTTRMWGTVVSYVSGTGVLTLNVLGRVGVGTLSDWTVTTRPANAGIDGLPSYVVWPGERRTIYIDGTAYKSTVAEPYYFVRTVSATYVHPPGYPGVEHDLVGGGGGGGSGARHNTGNSVLISGGSNGGAPARVRSRQFGFVAGQSYPIVSGAAGAAGNAITTDNTDGQAGTTGGNTTFGGRTAFGGIAGLGGTRGAAIDYPVASGSGSAGAGTALYLGAGSGFSFARGGVPNIHPASTTTSTFVNNTGDGGGNSTNGPAAGNTEWGGAGGCGSSVGAGPRPAGSSLYGVPAAGCGGCLTAPAATPTATAGDAGLRGSYTPGGLAGGTCGVAPTAGTNGAVAANDQEVGGSGSGGGSTTSGVAAGKGGDGGFPGGAGGGGGASPGSTNSGAGGAGAAGRAWLRGIM